MSKRLRVFGVTEGAQAQTAGITEGDYIFQCNGVAVFSSEGLDDVMSRARLQKADKIPITVYRKGTFVDFHVSPGVLGVRIGEVDFSAEEQLLQLRETMRSKSQESFRSVLSQYVGTEIQFNLVKPLETTVVSLVGVAIDHFAVFRNEAVHRFPYSQILRIVEPYPTGTLEVFVWHQVVYKGAIGVGFSFPV